MRTLFTVSVVVASFAVYACSSSDPAEEPSAVDGGQDAPVTAQDGASLDAGADVVDASDAAMVDADAPGECTRNEVADSNCSSQSRKAYLCPGDAGPGDAGPVCDFFTGIGDVSLYCCE